MILLNIDLCAIIQKIQLKNILTLLCEISQIFNEKKKLPINYYVIKNHKN